MLRRAAMTVAPLAAVMLVACGGDRRDAGGATTTAPATPPALAAPAPKAGELVFRSEASPRTHGPFELDGAYDVRFEQIAPEDPTLDFAGQTPFTAALQRRAGDPSGAVELFGDAARTGRRAITARGRYVLEVSFGDFPYAVRLTPRR